MHRSIDMSDEGPQIGDHLRLRRNFYWTLGGSVLYAGCQWAMLVALAKVGSPRMVGQLALALAITTPIIVVANLNLRVVQATDVRHEYAFHEYVGVRVAMLLLATAAIAAAASRYDRYTVWVIAMVAIAKVFDSLSDVVYGLLQLHEHMRRIAISRVLQGVLQLVVLTAVVRHTGNLIWAAAAMAAGSALVTILYDAPSVALVGDRALRLTHAWKMLRAPWQPRRLWTLVCTAFPLGMVAGLHTLNANIPRFFIERSMGTHALGIFAAIWYLVPTGGLVLGAMVQAAAPRLARSFLDDPRQYARLLWRLIALAAANGCAGVVLALTFGRPFLTVLYAPEYAEYPAVFVWIMVGAALGHLAWALAGGVCAARYFSAQLPVYALAALATALASAWLIPTYELAGAAWALCVGAAVCVAGFGGIAVYALRARSRAWNGRAQPLVVATGGLKPSWT